MPRFARVVIPQCPHHVTQRGNERRDVFFADADRDVYLGLLRRYGSLYEVDVLGFCLMTNHVHLVLQPQRIESLARLLREVQMRYSQYRHAVEGCSGHLWQCRYYFCPVESERLGSVMRYVELNPVRAGHRDRGVPILLEQCRGPPWPWRFLGSARDGRLGKAYWSVEEWATVLREGADERRPNSARQPTAAVRSGPSRDFVGRLEDASSPDAQARQAGASSQAVSRSCGCSSRKPINTRLSRISPTGFPRRISPDFRISRFQPAR